LKYGNRLFPCRAQNEEKAAEKIIGLLEKGQNVAYASDAGTPGISDPGAVLAELVRKAGYTVIPVPGPSAFAALVSVAGSGGKTLIFEGFFVAFAGEKTQKASGAA
jgi:16S rRNA (cytidine1402-2'-O)-methyltransferase